MGTETLRVQQAIAALEGLCSPGPPSQSRVVELLTSRLDDRHVHVVLVIQIELFHQRLPRTPENLSHRQHSPRPAPESVNLNLQAYVDDHVG